MRDFVTLHIIYLCTSLISGVLTGMLLRPHMAHMYMMLCACATFNVVFTVCTLSTAILAMRVRD